MQFCGSGMDRNVTDLRWMRGIMIVGAVLALVALIAKLVDVGFVFTARAILLGADTFLLFAIALGVFRIAEMLTKMAEAQAVLARKPEAQKAEEQ